LKVAGYKLRVNLQPATRNYLILLYTLFYITAKIISESAADFNILVFVGIILI